MLSTRIINDTTFNKKMLAAILALLSARLIVLASVLGAFLLGALFMFILIIDALSEMACHIAQVWNGSSSIERLILFLIAWAFCWKLTPVACSIIKRGWAL